MNPLQCITVQYMPWHGLAYSRAISSRDTPLESSILLETRRNGGQPKELSHGYSIYDHWIVNTTRRRRWVIAESGLGREGTVKSSGTSARERRLEKYREEKRRREHQNKNVYPEWAKVLEEACKDDKELREIIGDSIGNADMMRKRVEERVRMKGRDIIQSKSGSVLPVKVSFRNYVGIKQLVFGGKSLGDWEEGMTSVEDGYRVYQI